MSDLATRKDSSERENSNSGKVVYQNMHPEIKDSHAEILKGLKSKPKTINPKYFYDTHGSELFEQITNLEEYYPTRTERMILSDNAQEIADLCGQDCVLIEPGSGSSEKVRLILDALKPSAYVPMDIAGEFLHRSALKLGEQFPWLNVHALCADFNRYKLEQDELPEGKRVIFYPGSTLGNMTPDAAVGFLDNLRSWVGKDGGVLIGIDLHKDASKLNTAYNDKQGVTAAFNLNVLSHINTLAEANFSLDNFEHLAFYNDAERRIEMHLSSLSDQIVRVENSAIALAKGERIHTENSYKYTLESFQALIARAGLGIQKTWLDTDNLFSVHYLSVEK